MDPVSRLVNSFLHINPENDPNAENQLLKLYKHPAMVMDQQVRFFYAQTFPKWDSGNAVLLDAGTQITVPINDISNYLNSLRIDGGNYIFRLSLVEASTSVDAAKAKTKNTRYLPQTLYIRAANFGRPSAYHWTTSPGSIDKSHVSHSVFSDQIPNEITLNYGHVAINENNNTSQYFDYNTAVTAPVQTNPVGNADIYFDQQLQSLTMRFQVSIQHLF